MERYGSHYFSFNSIYLLPRLFYRAHEALTRRPHHLYNQTYYQSGACAATHQYFLLRRNSQRPQHQSYRSVVSQHNHFEGFVCFWKCPRESNNSSLFICCQQFSRFVVGTSGPLARTLPPQRAAHSGSLHMSHVIGASALIRCVFGLVCVGIINIFNPSLWPLRENRTASGYARQRSYVGVSRP